MTGMRERLQKEMETRLKTFRLNFDTKLAETAAW